MNCRAVRGLAAAYALDALSERERQDVERHLDMCGACRALVAELSETTAGLARSTRPQAPPAELKAHILQAAAQTRAIPEPLPAVHAGRRPGASAAVQPAPPTPGHGGQNPAPRAGRLAARRTALRVAAAVALLALGWGVGRMLPGSGAPAQQSRLEQMALERELWRSLAPPGAAVMGLSTDPSLTGAVAYASVVGDATGCRVRLVARGLPDPPAGARYMAWVSTTDGRWQRIGAAGKSAPGWWELAALIQVPPQRLGELRLVLQEDGAAGPEAGTTVAWGQLWPQAYGW